MLQMPQQRRADTVTPIALNGLLDDTSASLAMKIESPYFGATQVNADPRHG